nr:MAG TPA: hypothetical protein [Caudoviricetes sp.]
MTHVVAAGFWLAATPWPEFLRRWRRDGSNAG